VALEDTRNHVALIADTLAVDDAHLPQPGRCCLPQVLLDDLRDVPGRYGMEVEGIGQGNWRGLR
jgi:hypothetical protein